MPGLTAKMFRTYAANSLFQKELSIRSLGESKDAKIRGFYLANLKVTIFLNHRKKITPAYMARKDKMIKDVNKLEGLTETSNVPAQR